MARGLSSRLNQLADLMLFNASKAIREATIAGTEQAVRRTPVKTGNARINWRITFGRPSFNLETPPNTANRRTNAEIAAAQALIDAANKIKGWKIGMGNIIIANPVHYINKLDKGSSRQAMEGMSKFAIIAIKDRLRKARLLKRGG